MLEDGYGIMPNKVLFDGDVSSTAKLIYVYISSLCAKSGHCFASNEHIADKFGISMSQVSRLIAELKPYIAIEGGFNQKRLISLSESAVPPTQKAQGSLRKNAEHNSTSSNNKNILKNQLVELNQKLGRTTNIVINDTRLNKLRRRLEHFTFEQLATAAEAIKASDFMVSGGHNNIDYLVRNDEKVEQWLNKAPQKRMITVEGRQIESPF